MFPQDQLNNLISFSIPAILIVVLYFSIRMEVSTYFDQLYNDSFVSVQKAGMETPDNYWNYDLLKYKTVWLINYSLLFFAVLSFVNIQKIRNKGLGMINIGLNTLVILAYLTIGLYSLSELRESYLNQVLSEHYQISNFNIWIRYISLGFLGAILLTSSKIIQQDFIQRKTKSKFFS